MTRYCPLALRWQVSEDQEVELQKRLWEAAPAAAADGTGLTTSASSVVKQWKRDRALGAALATKADLDQKARERLAAQLGKEVLSTDAAVQAAVDGAVRVWRDRRDLVGKALTADLAKGGLQVSNEQKETLVSAVSDAMEAGQELQAAIESAVRKQVLAPKLMAAIDATFAVRQVRVGPAVRMELQRQSQQALTGGESVEAVARRLCARHLEVVTQVREALRQEQQRLGSVEVVGLEDDVVLAVHGGEAVADAVGKAVQAKAKLGQTVWDTGANAISQAVGELAFNPFVEMGAAATRPGSAPRSLLDRLRPTACSSTPSGAARTAKPGYKGSTT